MKRASLLGVPYFVYALIFIVAPLILILFYSLTFKEQLDDGTAVRLASGTSVTVDGVGYTVKEDAYALLEGKLTLKLDKGARLESADGALGSDGSLLAVVESGTRIWNGKYGNFLLVLENNNNYCSQITLQNFFKFFNPTNPQYLSTLWRSFYLAFISTLICLLLGYPMAYILSRLKPKIRNIVSFLFILPMWMNFLLRTYAWMTILENTGLINSLLGALGFEPIQLMYTQGSVVLGMVYNFLPFMILPIYNQLIRLDPHLLEAADDLGAKRRQSFFRVTFPLSFPGVMSGITMTFMPAVTTFVISKLLGGGQNALIGDLIEQQFKTAGDWGFGSAMSVVLMALMLLTIGFISRFEKQQTEGGGVLG